MQSLEGILERLVEQVDGASVAAIGSTDGLVVEQHPPAEPDLTAAMAELTHVLVGVRRALEDHLAAGPAREVLVASERLLTLVRVVTPELYLLVALEPGGDLEAARRHADEAAEGVLGMLA